MSEVDMEDRKPEMMKSYVWLKTSDGSIQQVEQDVAMYCPTICQQVIQKGLGVSKTNAISLSPKVTPAMLSLILEYCRFHQKSGRSNKERKSFDEKFIRTMDSNRLCELTTAADSVKLQPLVDLSSRTLARLIEGKTPEELRAIFHLPDDLTEEEKLEPLKNAADDPRIRLLNRLYAKRRKELEERGKRKSAEVKEERVDNRSVDELLSFINGEKEDSREIKPARNKKKHQKKKDQQKNSSSLEATESHKQESIEPHFIHHTARPGSDCQPELAKTSNMQVDDEIFVPKEEFDDGFIDDEIDPALKEKIDREVEDFARRLNSEWPVRMQEILSSGQQMRPLQPSKNDNATVIKSAMDQIQSRNDPYAPD